MIVKYIPDFLKPLLREIKFRLLKSKSFENYEELRISLLNQWERILHNSKNIITVLDKHKKNKKILFVTGYGVMGHYQAIEPLIILSLIVRGCKISSLYCNISLPACEVNIVGNNKPKSINNYRKGIITATILDRCKHCKSNIEESYSRLPIDLLGLNQYLTEDDYSSAEEFSRSVKFEEFRSFVYNEIAVGEEAYSSILRVTLMGEVKDTKINRHLVQRYIMSGILTVIGYEKAFTYNSPDRIVAIHGVYQTHGLAVKVAKKLHIPVIVLGGGGIRKDTAILCHGETYHLQLVNEPNDKWINKILTEEERNKTLQYAINKRTSGAGVDYLSYHPNPIEDDKAIYDYCKINRTRKIISLFTNVIWDAQIFYGGNAFKNIFEWLFLTIETLAKNDNVWIIIRIHPAESKGAMPTKQPMSEEIKKRFPNLPVNVKIIPPESDISSYTLAKISHANIIYGTKMGLEIALLKRPLIICGETFSRNKGYGKDIVSKEQYIELLSNIHNYETNNEENFEIALKYAHYFYFRRMIDLPIESLNPGFGYTKTQRLLKFNSLEDLKPGNNKAIDTICDGIINLTDFIL